MTLVHHFLETAARRHPDSPALIDLHRTARYGELDRLANRAANILVDSGVRRGDRVAIAVENSIEFVAAYMGALKAGAVAVPLPADPRNDRLPRAVRDCSPVAAVVDSAVATELCGSGLGSIARVFVRTTTRDVPPGCNDFGAALSAAPDGSPGVRTIDLDLAAIIYTSGSTGTPRGVMLTHRNIATNTRSIVEYLRLTALDRVMCILPFYYVYGLSLLHTHLAAAGSIVLDTRFAYPHVVVEAMRQHEVTGFAGVPSTFTLLLHRADLTGAPVRTLRYVTQAGGAMPVARIQEWLARGWQVPLYVMYGATEASARLTYLEPAMLLQKLGAIGRPIPNVEIAVLREDGTLAAPGEVGELVARGSNIAIGYWNDPVETSRKFGPQGYRTGDVGYADEDGYLFLLGRRHDMIKVGAHRVGAQEIEDVLCQHPNVLEAAVVPVAHEILGEAPLAFVALRDSDASTSEPLQAYCRRRLPPYKVPMKVVVLSELPKMDGSGKIDRAMIRNTLAEAHSGARTSSAGGR